eukprot:gene17466-19213_t
MVLLEQEAFLVQLASLFSATKTSGTVYVTLKKYNGQTKPRQRKSKKGDASKSQEHLGESRCLFRATNGKRKISTVVLHKDVNKFQLAYANLLKTNIDNLKKRDRKKAKKNKSTEK